MSPAAIRDHGGAGAPGAPASPAPAPAVSIPSVAAAGDALALDDDDDVGSEIPSIASMNDDDVNVGGTGRVTASGGAKGR